MEVGQRVVRGADWRWGDQDGGEGSVGTVVIVGRSGSLSSPDKTVIVQWDGGTRTNYRCGYNDGFDLRLLDNGPIGISHSVSCSECQQQRIEGIRWQCADCNGSNLCSTCYHADKHSLQHHFSRINSPSSLPVCVGARQGLQKVIAKGTYTNAIVVRGPDWDWGNQDGGPKQKGLVTAVKGWDTETFSSVVSVTWDQNINNVYRRGHKGKVDVLAATPAEAGYYYKDHLPQLGVQSTTSTSSIRDLQEATPPETQFVVGDKVRILLDVDVLKSLQRGYGGWDDRMIQVIGLTGNVLSISSHGVVVKFPVSHPAGKMVVNPLALSKVQNIHANDSVSILDNYELVKKLQACHGEWTDGMKTILGKEGKVQKIYSDGDVQVHVGKALWTLNPAVLTKINKTTTARQPQPTHTQVSPTILASSTSSSSAAEASLPQLHKMNLAGNEVTTKLILAAGQGQYTKVRDILSAEPSKVNENQRGKTALHVSSHQGHVDVVKLLLKYGANSNTQDDDGDTSLHYAAFGNKPLVATALIQHGANLDTLNTNNLTALHISANKGHDDMVQTLVVAGCNVNIQDSSGETVLHCAITNDSTAIFNILINSNKCDLSITNRQGFNVFHRAALKGRQQALITLLNKSPALLNSVKDDGFTALHLAALNGHIGLVEVLLAQAGCVVNTINQNHQTALLLAADKRHTQIVQLLLEHNADPNIQDDVGDTPLHVAAVNHNHHGNTGDNSCADVIQLLVEHRADTKLRNHDNKIPADLCRDEEMASWLRTAASSTEQPPMPEPTTSSAPLNITATCSETSNTCRLCGKPVDCQFEPCGDSVVCYACSHMFKACIQCKATVESVTKLDDTTLKECVVCEESTANVIFEPCLHQVVCSECCVRMKKCTVCRQVIVNKKTSDVSTSKPDEQKYGCNMDSLVYLQAKVQEMEEEQICAICMDNKRSIVFLCGHSTCNECCQSLRECHMCRKPIEKKITLFS